MKIEFGSVCDYDELFELGLHLWKCPGEFWINLGFWRIIIKK